MKLDDEAKKKGLIASSAGNHAQGVAYAAKKLGVKATICMPAHTPLIKVDATKAHGADVVLYGEAYDEAYEKAVELQKSEGYRSAICLRMLASAEVKDTLLFILLMMKMLWKGKEQLL